MQARLILILGVLWLIALSVWLWDLIGWRTLAGLAMLSVLAWQVTYRVVMRARGPNPER